MRHGAAQQFIADAAALLIGRDEQFRQEPQAAAHPAESEAEDVAALLRDPQAVAIVLQRERLEVRRPRRCHAAESVPHR
jgi:hypothetical protein